MVHKPTDELLQWLQNGAKEGSGGWHTRSCPAHEDKNPSLRFKYNEADDNIGVHCFKGCTPQEVLDASGIEGKPRLIGTDYGGSSEVAMWPIYDASGEWQADHIRLDKGAGKKSFSWRSPGDASGLNGRKKVTLPLYGSELISGFKKSEPVLITEGPKCADLVRSKGLQSLGTVTGAASCPSPETLEPLLGLERVVLLPDDDQAGREHMRKVGERLLDLRLQPFWLELSKGGETGRDVEQYFQDGNDGESLLALADRAEPLGESGQKPEREYAGPLPEEYRPELLGPPKWFLKDFILEGGVTVLFGDPGCGKSSLMIALAAEATAGIGPFEGQPPRTVAYITSENSFHNFVMPRFLAYHGADPERLKFFSGSVLDGFSANDSVESIVAHYGPAMVVLDPATSFVAGKINEAAVARKLIDPLNRTAQDHGCAVVVVHHPRKPADDSLRKGPPSYHEAAGSGQVVAGARMVLAAWESPQGVREVVVRKANDTKVGHRMRFELLGHSYTDGRGDEAEVPKVVWLKDEVAPERHLVPLQTKLERHLDFVLAWIGKADPPGLAYRKHLEAACEETFSEDLSSTTDLKRSAGRQGVFLDDHRDPDKRSILYVDPEALKAYLQPAAPLGHGPEPIDTSTGVGP